MTSFGNSFPPGPLPERGIITGGLYITMPASGVKQPQQRAERGIQRPGRCVELLADGSVIGDGEVTSILLVILFASSLERLILLDPAKPISISVHRAPKLRVLGYATTRSSFLRIGGITIKVQQSSS